MGGEKEMFQVIKVETTLPEKSITSPPPPQKKKHIQNASYENYGYITREA